MVQMEWKIIRGEARVASSGNTVIAGESICNHTQTSRSTRVRLRKLHRSGAHDAGRIKLFRYSTLMPELEKD